MPTMPSTWGQGPWAQLSVSMVPAVSQSLTVTPLGDLERLHIPSLLFPLWPHGKGGLGAAQCRVRTWRGTEPLLPFPGQWGSSSLGWGPLHPVEALPSPSHTLTRSSAWSSTTPAAGARKSKPARRTATARWWRASTSPTASQPPAPRSATNGSRPSGKGRRGRGAALQHLPELKHRTCCKEG